MIPFRIRRYLPRTLFARSLLIVVTPVLILQILMAYIMLHQHWEEVMNKLSQSVAREVAFVIELENAYPDQRDKILQLATDTTRMKFEQLPTRALGAEDEDRQSVVSRLIGGAIKHRLVYPTRVQLGRERETYEIEVSTQHGLLRVTVPESRVFTISTFQLMSWFVGTSTILLIIAILFLRGQVRPIRRLAEAAEAFGQGIDHPFKAEGAREVRRAAAAFILMRERIRRQIAQRTEMLAGVSHDLRTPITRMKLQLAMMKDGGAEEMKNDLAEMEAMIEAYLTFARGEGEESAAATRLDELLAQLAKDCARGSEEKIRLTAPSIKLTVRPQAMRRAFGNLIQNALSYGKQCQITATQSEDRAMILIDDDGPGIPAEAREDVFRPFYRLEQSRNRASGGIGLGLAIARDIIRTHGGEITLEDSPAGGLRARVELPRGSF